LMPAPRNPRSPFSSDKDSSISDNSLSEDDDQQLPKGVI
jgi:hypothetical protein